MKKRKKYSGFTLIEMSIVLVIIALIVGGVLVGRDLIASAAVRAQVTQIEKYNAAVNAFRGKYGYLPGDIPASAVAQFNFTAAPASYRGGGQGQGDGNGLIEGWSYVSNFSIGYFQTGEPYFFWEDLTTNSGLIGDGSFYYYPNPALGGYQPTVGANGIPNYLPVAKLNPNNYVMAFSSAGNNYFTVTQTTFLQNDGNINGAQNMTVQQAYSIDKKMDDGLPQTGNVQAQFLRYGVQWASGGGGSGVYGAAPGNSASPSSTSCYDNGGNASNTMAYSMTTNNGSGVNCALSFKFQ